MTLFGTTLDAEQMAGLVGMLALLAYWLFVLRGERDYARWFKRWEADRKARREAELAREVGTEPPNEPKGPRG